MEEWVIRGLIESGRVVLLTLLVWELLIVRLLVPFILERLPSDPDASIFVQKIIRPLLTAIAMENPYSESPAVIAFKLARSFRKRALSAISHGNISQEYVTKQLKKCAQRSQDALALGGMNLFDHLECFLINIFSETVFGFYTKRGIENFEFILNYNLNNYFYGHPIIKTYMRNRGRFCFNLSRDQKRHDEIRRTSKFLLIMVNRLNIDVGVLWRKRLLADAEGIKIDEPPKLDDAQFLNELGALLAPGPSSEPAEGLPQSQRLLFYIPQLRGILAKHEQSNSTPYSREGDLRVEGPSTGSVPNRTVSDSAHAPVSSIPTVPESVNNGRAKKACASSVGVGIPIETDVKGTEPTETGHFPSPVENGLRNQDPLQSGAAKAPTFSHVSSIQADVEDIVEKGNQTPQSIRIDRKAKGTSAHSEMERVRLISNYYSCVADSVDVDESEQPHGALDGNATNPPSCQVNDQIGKFFQNMGITRIDNIATPPMNAPQNTNRECIV